VNHYTCTKTPESGTRKSFPQMAVCTSMTFQELANFLVSEDCQNVVFAVGAGISVSAGISDYRSEGSGLYYNMHKYGIADLTPEKVMNIDFFLKHPEVVYQIDRHICPTDRWSPTITHHFMALLASKGKLKRVYTQNIDNLEAKAGVPEDLIVQAHGTLSSCRCHECQAPQDIVALENAILTDPIVPLRCSDCDGLVRHDVVFYGEPLTQKFLDFDMVQDDLQNADLLIVSGTSLLVAPFCTIPQRVREDCPRLLVNREKAGEESFIQKKQEEAKQNYSHISSNANVINIDIRMGTRVGIDGEDKQGIVRWVGRTRFAEGRWFGIELDNPVGNNDGSVDGRRYFHCEENHGLFVKKGRLKNLDSKFRKGFEFEKDDGNDVFVSGDADDGFLQLATFCGWEEELKAMM